MNKLINIFILFISLLCINSGKVNNLSINDVHKHSKLKEIQSFHPVSVSNFSEDSSSNENFDLEEDTDDTDNYFLKTSLSKNIILQSASPSIHFYYYSYSLHSIKSFILYCSLKLRC